MATAQPLGNATAKLQALSLDTLLDLQTALALLATKLDTLHADNVTIEAKLDTLHADNVTQSTKLDTLHADIVALPHS